MIQNYSFARKTCWKSQDRLNKYYIFKEDPAPPIYFAPVSQLVNPLNAELNATRHLLALVVARHIVHVSRIRVNISIFSFLLLSLITYTFMY